VLFAFTLPYYIFWFTFTAVPASLTVARKRTDYTSNESSREHSFPGECSRELSFLGAKVPTGNFRSEKQKYRGAKSPDTIILHTPFSTWPSFVHYSNQLTYIEYEALNIYTASAFQTKSVYSVYERYFHSFHYISAWAETSVYQFRRVDLSASCP